MILDDVCKSRRIGKIDVQTPLLVPSFSSVVCDIPSEMHAKLKDHITDASLFSAYDLRRGKKAKVTQEEIWGSNVVFVDSGNYEVQHVKDTLNQIHQTKTTKARAWTRQMHSKLIDSLRPPPLAKTVLVNYDEKKELEKQISSAHSFFARYGKFASCFLSRPCNNSSQVDMESLVDNVELLEEFDILGLTEKELGDSLVNRCTNILKLRKALNSHGSNTPIHVFGCLDPLGIVSYFLCGADIFDGTLWLKYGFHKNTAVYLNNYAMLMGKWASTDIGVLIMSWVLNLNDLRKLMLSMRRFAQDHNPDVFGFDQTIMEQITDLTKTAASGVG